MDAELKKWKTMEFMTGLMNHLSWIGAREEMRKFTQSKKGILEYVGDHSETTQMMLEYVYVFNRLGTLLLEDMLDVGILFKTWQPEKFF
ncbi:MAG: hypothetical protein Q8P08_02555, partial [bacterium]|nr:hypothetical protein [bacterium]